MKKESCEQCGGIGWYQYSGFKGDTPHSKICEMCCKHDKGFWKLTEHYGNDNGKLCCLDGCGFTKENDGTGIEIPKPPKEAERQCLRVGCPCHNGGECETAKRVQLIIEKVSKEPWEKSFDELAGKFPRFGGFMARIDDQDSHQITWNPENVKSFIRSVRALAIKEELKIPNGILRSMHAIVERHGLETNWKAFKIILERELGREHRIMHPEHNATSNETMS